MAEIGVRKLKEKTSEVIRKVREERAAYDVTYRGRVVARIIPAADRAFDKEKAREVLARMKELAKEIGEEWPKGVSAVDAIREDRDRL
jgi:prevent-host-death family protein